jgi:hypothetical protein
MKSKIADGSENPVFQVSFISFNIPGTCSFLGLANELATLTYKVKGMYTNFYLMNSFLKDTVVIKLGPVPLLCINNT